MSTLSHNIPPSSSCDDDTQPSRWQLLYGNTSVKKSYDQKAFSNKTRNISNKDKTNPTVTPPPHKHILHQENIDPLLPKPNQNHGHKDLFIANSITPSPPRHAALPSPPRSYSRHVGLGAGKLPPYKDDRNVRSSAAELREWIRGVQERADLDASKKAEGEARQKLDINSDFGLEFNVMSKEKSRSGGGGGKGGGRVDANHYDVRGEHGKEAKMILETVSHVESVASTMWEDKFGKIAGRRKKERSDRTLEEVSQAEGERKRNSAREKKKELDLRDVMEGIEERVNGGKNTTRSDNARSDNGRIHSSTITTKDNHYDNNDKRDDEERIGARKGIPDDSEYKGISRSKTKEDGGNHYKEEWATRIIEGIDYDEHLDANQQYIRSEYLDSQHEYQTGKVPKVHNSPQPESKSKSKSKSNSKSNSKSKSKLKSKSKSKNPSHEMTMKRANDTAIFVSLQRSRKRLLRRCLHHFFLFVDAERKRTGKIRVLLQKEKGERWKRRIVKTWGAYAKERTKVLMDFKGIRDRRSKNYAFGNWCKWVNARKRAVEDGGRKGTWRRVVKIIKSWRRYALQSRQEREGRDLKLREREARERNHRADSWYHSTLLRNVVVYWRKATKEILWEKKEELAIRKRRERGQRLLQRIENTQKGKREEQENEDGANDEENTKTEDRVEILRGIIEECLGTGADDTRSTYAHHQRGQQQPQVPTIAIERLAREISSQVQGSSSHPTSTTTPTNGQSTIETGRKESKMTISERRANGRERKTPHVVPKSVQEMFSRHSERKQKRKELSERYASKNLSHEEALTRKRDEEEKERKEKEREKKEIERRKEEIRVQEENAERMRRRDMNRLAKMHSALRLLRNKGWVGFCRVLDELRIKERKADVFNEDRLKVNCFRGIREYARARGELRKDMETLQLRKADEYHYDKLLGKVIRLWKDRANITKSKGALVRHLIFRLQAKRTIVKWTERLDEERILWWEADKHAMAQGRYSNLRYFFHKMTRGTCIARDERRVEERVKMKMKEVKKWLE